MRGSWAMFTGTGRGRGIMRNRHENLLPCRTVGRWDRSNVGTTTCTSHETTKGHQLRKSTKMKGHQSPNNKWPPVTKKRKGTSYEVTKGHQARKKEGHQLRKKTKGHQSRNNERAPGTKQKGQSVTIQRRGNQHQLKIKSTYNHHYIYIQSA